MIVVEKGGKAMQKVLTAICAVSLLTGCGSAYDSAISKSGLGAGQYRPAVVVTPGNEARYEQVLGICRNAAQNRQMTASQEAQLKTITGTAQSTVAGAAAGTEFRQIFRSAGFKSVGIGEAAGIGAATGLLTGLVGSMASGAESTAAATKGALLKCLRVTSKNGTLWQVVE